jgi:hypothetical protein
MVATREPCCTRNIMADLWIGNVDPDTTDEEIKELLNTTGSRLSMASSILQARVRGPLSC